MVMKIVKNDEKHFVDVFNNAGALNMRQHAT